MAAPPVDLITLSPAGSPGSGRAVRKRTRGCRRQEGEVRGSGGRQALRHCLALAKEHGTARTPPAPRIHRSSARRRATARTVTYPRHSSVAAGEADTNSTVRRWGRHRARAAHGGVGLGRVRGLRETRRRRGEIPRSCRDGCGGRTWTTLRSLTSCGSHPAAAAGRATPSRLAPETTGGRWYRHHR